MNQKKGMIILYQNLRKDSLLLLLSTNVVTTIAKKINELMGKKDNEGFLFDPSFALIYYANNSLEHIYKISIVGCETKEQDSHLFLKGDKEIILLFEDGQWKEADIKESKKNFTVIDSKNPMLPFDVGVKHSVENEEFIIVFFEEGGLKFLINTP